MVPVTKDVVPQYPRKSSNESVPRHIYEDRIKFRNYDLITQFASKNCADVSGRRAWSSVFTKKLGNVVTRESVLWHSWGSELELHLPAELQLNTQSSLYPFGFCLQKYGALQLDYTRIQASDFRFIRSAVRPSLRYFCTYSSSVAFFMFLNFNHTRLFAMMDLQSLIHQLLWGNLHIAVNCERISLKRLHLQIYGAEFRWLFV